MAETTLDIPVEALPFDAGRGFSAVVENDVAHVIVSSPEAEEKTIPPHGKTWAERARETGGNLTRQVFVEEAAADERYASILKKHAPELLD